MTSTALPSPGPSVASGPAPVHTLAVRPEDADAHGGSERASPSPQREVDYYLNPTELFRWINYRRWDGAKARVLSHPVECETWIVSRHSSDGRILWRHLPLHLVCMQSGGGGQQDKKDADPNSVSTAAQQRQVEELIDVLLDAYPEGASSPDDQGMLPLHLCIANNTLPNERILNLLLIANPKAVESKDKYGRTPTDILHEKNVGGARYDSALRAMTRAQRMTSRLFAEVQEESSQVVSSIRDDAAKERKASQRIILRLEDELSCIRQQTDDVENINKEEQEVRKDLEGQIHSLQDKLNRTASDLGHVREERDDLKSKNDTLKTQVEEHDNVISEVNRNFDSEHETQIDEIASLRSEVSTARAMAEALESQLRSRFTNEEYLSTTVGELESSMSKVKSEFDKERKQLLHEKETLINEKEQLKKTLEELTSKNITMQTKLSELSKQMSNILSNHSALNAEHDRLVDAANRHETDLIEAARSEREHIVTGMQKQRELLDAALAEQERIMEDTRRKEIEMMEQAKEERVRGTGIIERLRQDFRDARALALERERKIHAENLAVKNRQIMVTQTNSPYRNGVTTSTGGTPKREEKSISASMATKESVSSSQQTRRMVASRGGQASPVTPERSPLKYPSSPSTASQHSDVTSNVTTPSLPPQINNSRHQHPPMPRLTINTDQRQAPDGHLLRILDDRAEQGGGSAHGSRSTRAAPSPQSFADSTMKTPRRSGAEMQNASTSSSRGSRSTREKEHQTYGSAHQDADHSVKFAPANWGGSVESLSRANANAASWNRTSKSSPQQTPSSVRRHASPASVSLEEYSQASTADYTNDTGKGGSSYRQFSGMSAGMKNRLIRVGDQRSEASESYISKSKQYGRGKFSVVVEEERNDFSVGESTHSSGGYSR